MFWPQAKARISPFCRHCSFTNVLVDLPGLKDQLASIRLKLAGIADEIEQLQRDAADSDFAKKLMVRSIY